MSDITTIKQRLAKLIRLSEDESASAGEIDNALNMAAQLMAKHQLTRDDIDYSGTDGPDSLDRIRMGRHCCLAKGSRVTTWEIILSGFVSRLIGSVQHYLSREIKLLAGANGGAAYGSGFYYYGPQDDAEEAAELFRELQDTIAIMAIAKWGGYARSDGAAYAEGFVTALLEKLAAEIDKLKSGDEQTCALITRSESTALAITSRAREWLTETHGVRIKKKTVRGGTRTGSHAARRDGATDGSRYDVRRPGVKRKLA